MDLSQKAIPLREEDRPTIYTQTGKGPNERPKEKTGSSMIYD